jgi:lipoprotein-anchoring transpeptidase ErfK/SrfK
MRHSRRTRFELAAVLGLAAAVAAFASVAIGGGEGPAQAPAAALQTGGTALADAPEPAFEIPVPQALPAAAHESTWTVVKHTATARAGPGAGFEPLGRLEARTPEGTTNLALVLDRRRSSAGDLWILVRLPILPNNSEGWVPRAALGGYGIVDTHLIVDLGDRQATLLRAGRAIFRAPVGVGAARFPTPRGRFYVRNKLTRFRNPFYGPIAFGTSARSVSLTDWPAGGFIGIHGTNRPDLLPGAVSHGCIRLRNAAIRRLARLMPIGTPLTVRA